jgi:hypothetical protein
MAGEYRWQPSHRTPEISPGLDRISLDKERPNISQATRSHGGVSQLGQWEIGRMGRDIVHPHGVLCLVEGTLVGGEVNSEYVKERVAVVVFPVSDNEVIAEKERVFTWREGV